MRSAALGLLAALPMLAQWKTADPAAAGISAERLERAAALLEAETRAGRVTSAALLVARNGTIVMRRGFGAAQPDTVFLLASISKPITATALMLLVERGQVSLDDPAARYLPELKGEERGRIRVRDLLTHTSGLPDMLPENTDLRRAHAPLSEFVRHTFATPLLFPPRTELRYQSMGTLLAAEIVQRVSGMPLREFEQKEIFGPLGMTRTALGLGSLRLEDTAQCQTPPGPDSDRFGHNTPYWRNLGVPWGGVHSNTTDLAVLLQTFLNGGVWNGHRLLSPATVDRMITNQNPAPIGPWGLGWGLAVSPVWAYFGDLVSPAAFGHSGATGTVAWADPRHQLITVILTTRPSAADEGRLLRTVSNAVTASLE